MDRKTKLFETTRYLFECKYDAPDFDAVKVKISTSQEVYICQEKVIVPK